MKRNRLLLLLVIVVVLTMVLASCKCTHEEYTDWTITTDPTSTATGTATRKCVKCNEPETKTIPALSDTSVWTKSTTESVAPEHGAAGKDVYTSEYGKVTVILDPIEHTFDQEVVDSKYLKDAATCTTVAVYYKSCSCGQASATLTFEHGEILGHDAHHHDLVSATCTTDGAKEHWTCSREEGKYFTSEECTTEVEDGIVIPKLNHDVGDGEITVTEEPTLDAIGHATFTCVRDNCPVTDKLVTLDLAKLSDTTVWTVVTTPADYDNPETTTYTHKTYASIVITTTSGSPLDMPYAGKSYAIIEIETGTTNGVRITSGNNIATVNAEANTITGTAYPISGSKTINEFNPEKGTLLINDLNAWIDNETGFILLLRSANNYADFYVLIPVTGVTNESAAADRTTAVNAEKVKIAASQWDGNFTVTYTNDETPYGIFVTSDSVTLDVTFADEKGAALAAEACKTSANGVIVSKGAITIAAFETTDSSLVRYSRYTNGADVLKVYTNNTFVLGAKTGTYTVNSDDTLDAYVVADGKRVEHYTITLSDDGTYTLAEVKVEITFVAGEGGTLENTTQSLYVGCAISAVPTVNNPETTAFVGWCTELDDEDTIVNAVPATSTTLYAKYSTLVTYHIVDAVGGDKDIKIPSGQNVLAQLPQYTDTTINSADNTIFVRWQYTKVGEEPGTLASDMVAGEGDDGMILTAVWENAGRWYAFQNNTGAQFVYNDETKEWKTSVLAKSQYTRFNAIDGVVIISFKYRIEGGSYSDTLEIKLGSTIKVSQIRGNATGASTPKEFSIVLKAGEQLQIITTYDSTLSDNKGIFISDLIINGKEITKTGEYDMVEGTYTRASESNLVLDGYGNFTLGEQSGTYVVNDSDRTKLVASVVENGSVVGLYDITLDGTTYSAEVGRVTVTYNYGMLYYANRNKLGSEEKSHVAFEEVTLPTEGDFVTKTLNGVTYVFVGWYDGYTASSNKLTTITPTTAMDVYARYVDASTLVTVTYNHNVTDVDDKTVRVEKDKAVGELYVPTVSNGDKVFVGWFTKDGTDGDYGDEVTAASVFSEDVTVYAKWVTPNPMQGIYKGFSFGATYIDNEVIVANIDAEGNVTVTVGEANIADSVIEKQAADNVYRFVKGSDYYYAYFDGETLSVSTSINQDGFGDYAYVLEKVDSADVVMTAVSKNIYPAYWRDAETGLNKVGIVSVKVGDGAEEQIYYVINTHAAKVALTVVDANGQAVVDTASYAVYGNVITITNDKGVNVTKAYNGTTWVGIDSYKGNYTDATLGSFTIDGIKRVVVGNNSYDYTVVSDGVISVFINNQYYEISNMSAPTCTVIAYSTTVTFDIANGSVAGANADKEIVYSANIQVTLPTPTMDKGYGFFGWYDNAEFTGDAITTVTFAKDVANKTYYAKVEEVPAWSSMSTAETVEFVDNKVNIVGATNEKHLTAYYKFEVKEAGIYYIFGEVSSTGGEGTTYSNYSVLTEQGTAVTKLAAQSFGYTIGGPYELTSGTYFYQISLAGKVVGASNNSTRYGTFDVDIVRAVSSTADTAIEYTVGVETNAKVQSAHGKTINAIYKVELNADVTYTLTYSPEERSQLAIRTKENISSNANIVTTGWITAGTSATPKEFTVTTSGTYYIVVTSNSTFNITGQDIGGDETRKFAGKTLEITEDGIGLEEDYKYYYQVKFDQTDAELTGKIRTFKVDQYMMYEETGLEEVAFTATMDNGTITFKFDDGRADVVATYTATTIVFPSSCSVSKMNGKTVTVK